MSFVYAEKAVTEDNFFKVNTTHIFSDTKTQLIGAYLSNWSKPAREMIEKYGFTKCINVFPKISVSFAGNNTIFAHHLLNWMCNQSCVSAEEAINKAYEIHMSTDKDDIEFIICYADENDETHIACIKERQIQWDLSSAWIGSYDAFRKLQELRNLDSTSVTSCTSTKQFKQAIEECGDDSVGGFVIYDMYDNISHSFIFPERLDASADRTQLVPPNGAIQFSRSAAVGDCTMHFLESRNDVIIEFSQIDTQIWFTDKYRYTKEDWENTNTNHFLLPCIPPEKIQYDKYIRIV